MSVTGGVPGFDDTFFAGQKNDGKYMHRLARDLVRLRGIDISYYRKMDVPIRIDGTRPVSDKKDISPFDIKRRSGSATLYGEPLLVGKHIDAVRVEVTPAWAYAEPVEIRGVALRTVQSDIPDERGHILTNEVTFYLSKDMCDEISLTPAIGDVLLLPPLLNTFFDVKLIRSDNHRFGASGFFTAYELDLYKSSKFLPELKNIKTVSNPQ